MTHCESLFNVDFTGNAGNSLYYNNGMKFSTHDVDNDKWLEGNCARDYHGAWWFTKCSLAHLNGIYLPGNHNQSKDGILWYHFKGRYYSYKIAKMKVGPGKI